MSFIFKKNEILQYVITYGWMNPLDESTEINQSQTDKFSMNYVNTVWIICIKNNRESIMIAAKCGVGRIGNYYLMGKVSVMKMDGGDDLQHYVCINI